MDPKGRRDCQTVESLIAELRQRPPLARVFKWAADKRRFVPIGFVSAPSLDAEPMNRSLPAGSVVLWAEGD